MVGKDWNNTAHYRTCMQFQACPSLLFQLLLPWAKPLTNTTSAASWADKSRCCHSLLTNKLSQFWARHPQLLHRPESQRSKKDILSSGSDIDNCRNEQGPPPTPTARRRGLPALPPAGRQRQLPEHGIAGLWESCIMLVHNFKLPTKIWNMFPQKIMENFLELYFSDNFIQFLKINFFIKLNNN